MIARAAAFLLVAAIVGWTFSPALHFPFLNWDDDAVVVENAALERPDVLRWSFTTTYMEHYQPVSWLVGQMSADSDFACWSKTTKANCESPG